MRRLVCALVLAALVPCAAAWTWPVRGPVLQTFSFDPAHPYAAGEHRGIAIGADSGAQVVAPAAGTVTFAGTVPTNGKSVTILTPSGLAVSLTHLGSIAVAQNASVAEGDVVGSVGPSGTPEVDVPYVHLGIRRASDDQGYLDPLGFRPAPAPAAPQPAPAPTSAPAPAPAAPPAAPAVAVPQPAAPPAPAPASAPQQAAGQQPSPASPAPPVPVAATPAASAPAPAAAPAPPAEAPDAPGLTVGPAPAPAPVGGGVAVHARPAPPRIERIPTPQRAVQTAVPRNAAHAAVAGPARRMPHLPARWRPQLDLGSGSAAVPTAAGPVQPRSFAAATHEAATAHSHVQFAVGLSALAAAVVVALLWTRRRLRLHQRERTALV